MNKTLKWIVGVLLLLGIAAGAYFWAIKQIDTNFNYRSLLKDAAPTPGEALGEASTGRMVIVLIDGLRYDTSLKTDVMPTLNQLRKQGASALMHSQPPSYSEPGYSTLFIGAWPEINDGPVINLDYEDIPTWTQDNLFSSAHRAGWKTAISGYYWFEKLVPQSDMDYSFYTPGEDDAADQDVVKAALSWLKEEDAQLILVHIDQVDYAGHHEGGALSANWDAAAARSDAMLAELLAEMDLSKDTLVVLSDHGHIDAGGHGGQDAVALLEPFVIAGAGVKSGEYKDMQMVDVAPTLSALLGTSLPASTQGQVRTEMLSLPASVSAALPSAVKTQQTQLLNAYAAAMQSFGEKMSMPDSSNVKDYQDELNGLRTQRLFSERLKRALPIALLLAVAVTLILRQRKNGSLAWVLGGLIFVMLFNLRYALLDGKTYSLSSIISQTDLIVYTAVTTAISLLIAWLVASLINKSFNGSANANDLRTLGFGFTVVFIAGLPVWWSYLLNGPLVTWTLPDYLTSFLALIGLIQILVISVLTPLLAGITALVSKLNHN